MIGSSSMMSTSVAAAARSRSRASERIRAASSSRHGDDRGGVLHGDLLERGEQQELPLFGRKGALSEN